MFEFADPRLTVSATSGVINQQGRPFTHGFEIHLEKATLLYELAVLGGEGQDADAVDRAGQPRQGGDAATGRARRDRTRSPPRSRKWSRPCGPATRRPFWVATWPATRSSWPTSRRNRSAAEAGQDLSGRLADNRDLRTLYGCEIAENCCRCARRLAGRSRRPGWHIFLTARAQLHMIPRCPEDTGPKKGPAQWIARTMRAVGKRYIAANRCNRTRPVSMYRL